MADPDNKFPYKRLLLKISGEALAGQEKHGFQVKIIDQIAEQIKRIHELGLEVGLVIGAGNIFRGALGESLGLKRFVGDQMGMLATVINSLAFQDVLAKKGLPARVMTALKIQEVAEPYYIPQALEYLQEKQVLIIAGGTGNPFFTTDTAASLRAIELEADLLLKATRVDGVFSGDPEKDDQAQKIDQISYLEVIKRGLKVMDLTAISLCQDNNLPIMVFDLFKKESLLKIVSGQKIGTKIC